MRGTTRTVAVAAMSAVALLAAGCGNGGESGGSSSSAAGGQKGGEITVRGCNPQNPLVPSNTTETCGGNVIDAIFSKLVHYDAETAKPENDLAESIETTDNQNFTVKVKQGNKFADGTDVTAKSFVDAWNYAAYGPNAQSSGYFMEPIEGFGDTQCTGEGDDPCAGAGKAKAETLTGLKVVDDYTFTIKTSEKVSNLPVRLGYSAFAPLPEAFFKDPKAFGDKPIGNGPYKLDAWNKEQSIVLSKNPDYKGAFGGKVDKITFKIYQDSDSAYNDVLANNLDITDEIPASALIDDKYKSDLPDRNAQKETGVIQTITFAPTKVDPNYADPKIRQAISMAIDRNTIIKQIFNGTREPATGWVSPVVDGYKADQCGEYCTYDAAKAKALLTEAGGFKGDKITLSYNADAAHKEWTEATCNSIKQALGVDCVATGVVDFATFRSQIADRKMKGMFRTGWQMDYPSIENFLAPIFKTGASSNDGDYSNPAFDKLLTEAAAETDAAAANQKYQEAEALLAQDMPAIPMWYGKTTMGWSDKVTGVKITAFGTIDFSSVALK
ncbi:peptide ABC transporter substrate-binding protein [Phycicoccus duodecadis]|uniref:Oligopeptide transport system substrate-binding protein n=1 Tax=Phycicoccus duodecadis TaxID=173053 RepID=A0A2N3YGU8_9MICO|nr:ABC transporter substrate-binding protein [Phycicoccus duodecadis]PKW26092.1 oligopeptide transport system substrate-binding protein [Phycicoccus duodecadis]